MSAASAEYAIDAIGPPYAMLPAMMPAPTTNSRRVMFGSRPCSWAFGTTSFPEFDNGNALRADFLEAIFSPLLFAEYAIGEGSNGVPFGAEQSCSTCVSIARQFNIAMSHGSDYLAKAVLYFLASSRFDLAVPGCVCSFHGKARAMQ
jgi:hypothetical protein